MVYPRNKENISEWYLEVLKEAEIFDYGPVKGTIIFKPYGYALWENIQKILDKFIKEEIGALNSYFPIFIPESFLKKEKEHLEGFSPEVAVVTYAGGEELSEKLIVRPTSETIMYDAFSRWIKSYRDLPLIVNQWCNVIRWEKRPFPFLRNTEFLWQEGHGVHATHEDSLRIVLKALEVYLKVYQEYLGIFGFAGQKSESEKFAGALKTFTYEILMPDGKALQGCTSHDLGQNFSIPFEIRFQDRDMTLKYVWQNSWGFSTRSLGALFMVHGDEYGLILPPKIAPYEFVIVPIYDGENNEKIDLFAKKIIETLKEKNISVFYDTSEETPGFKFNKWELKGAPFRLELGKKEIEEKKITFFRRDTREKISLSLENLLENLKKIEEEYLSHLLEKSKNFTLENLFEVNSYEEFKKVMEDKRGFLSAFWCEREECEIKIKEETKATTRCLPLEFNEEKGKCIYCQNEARRRWIFAQSY